MVAVAARDGRAQAALVERLARRVRRVALLLCRSAADADDAAQAALMEILGSAATFRVATSLERWADRITTRTALRMVRRERTKQGLLGRWLVPGVLPWGGAASAGPSEPLGLSDILSHLAPERREALVLRHALGYSVDEIAEVTGSPAGTVKDRLVAARKQIRRLLDRDALRLGRAENTSTRIGGMR